MTPFGDLRAAVVAALDPVIVAHDDWTVYPAPVDAISPPAYLLKWADPWGPERRTFCQYVVTLELRAVAGRIDPDPGLDMLEEMVAAAVVALDTARLPVASWSTPRPLQLGGIAYQAASMFLSQTVTLGGS